MAGDVRFHRWELGFKQSGFHPIARALQAPDLRVCGPCSRSRRARVPFGFRRQVSRWPRGRSFRTSSILDGDLPSGEVAHVVSRAGSRVSWEALLECGTRMGSSALIQRLGCLLDIQRTEIPPASRRALEGLVRPGSKILLGSKARWGTAGSVLKPWNVVVNVPLGVLEPSPGRTRFEFKRRETQR